MKEKKELIDCIMESFIEEFDNSANKEDDAMVCWYFGKNGISGSINGTGENIIELLANAMDNTPELRELFIIALGVYDAGLLIDN